VDGTRSHVEGKIGFGKERRNLVATRPRFAAHLPARSPYLSHHRTLDVAAVDMQLAEREALDLDILLEPRGRFLFRPVRGCDVAQARTSFRSIIPGDMPFYNH
jgi:hypothetical protein